MRALRERFEEKVDRSGGPDACWPWTAGCGHFGHGQIREAGAGSRQLKASRVAWELTHGPIPAGLIVRHRCDNPPCCNPRHLELGSQRDNMRDRVSRGRWSGNNKLSAENVIVVLCRLLVGHTQRRIAADFGVCRAAINHLATGRRSCRNYR